MCISKIFFLYSRPVKSCLVDKLLQLLETSGHTRILTTRYSNLQAEIINLYSGWQLDLDLEENIVDMLQNPLVQL